MSAKELKRFALFAEFSGGDRDAVFEMLEERKASRGVALFREGSPAEGLVLLRSGEARIESKRTTDASPLKPGDAVGALSLVVVGPRECTAIAEKPCQFWLLSRTAFLRLADDYPRTACRLTEAIAVGLASTLRDALDATAQGLQAQEGR